MLEFLVHIPQNIKGKSHQVLPVPTIFLVTIKCLENSSFRSHKGNSKNS